MLSVTLSKLAEDGRELAPPLYRDDLEGGPPPPAELGARHALRVVGVQADI